MASYNGLRRTTRVVTVFLCGTILATIYLGWHFAIDDVAGRVSVNDVGIAVTCLTI